MMCLSMPSPSDMRVYAHISPHLNEARQIFRILPAELLAVVHPVIGLENRVDPERPRAEHRIGLESTQDGIQACISKAS